MKRLIGLSLAALAANFAAPALAQDAMNEASGPAAADPVEDASGMNVTFGLSAATDYVWRGVSQSDNDPAVFATVQVNYNGFYAGAGTENVDFLGINQEYDLWAGYVFKLGGKTSLDLGVVRYGYVDSPVDIDTVEIKAAVSTALGKTGLGVSGYWTPDYFGSNDDAFYLEGTISQPLTARLSASAGLGHQWIGAGGDYTTWNVGLSYEVLKGVKADVRYYDTDVASPLTNSRLVGSFSVAF